MRQIRQIGLIGLILLIGVFFRFYKLDWGEGQFAHPDEYHIVIAVSKLNFPTSMHPDFFSYGTVTIYLIYFTKEFFALVSTFLNSELLTQISSSHPSTFLIGRFYSALFSTLTIFLVFKTISYLLPFRFAALSALLVALTPGLIQQAHFMTPESSLIFFIFLSLLFLIKFNQDLKLKSLILASVSLGLSLGVKISSAVLGIALTLVLLQKFINNPLKLVSFSLLSILIIFITLGVGAPFIFLDFPKFKGNLDYEGGLALGQFDVFYTRQFIDTLPFIFHLEKIFPATLGLALLSLGLLGLGILIYQIIRYKELKWLVIVLAFLVFFIPNGLMFAKWTRFSSPTFPFFAILASFLIYKAEKFDKLLGQFLASVLVLLTFIWALCFFSIYVNPDVRVTASKWIEENLPQKSVFLLEGANTVDIPLFGDFEKFSLDFYPFDTEEKTRKEIAEGLERADYFIVQSRRVFMNHQRVPEKYPKLASFYDKLFDQRLGFTKIAEVSSYPSLAYLGIPLEFPDEGAEETWSVFDHPVIRIYRKEVRLTQDEYLQIIEN